MNSNNLVKAVQQLCRDFGYSPHISVHEQPPLTSSQKSVALLEFPQFRSIEGSKHGRITYRVTLKLLHRAANLTAEERSLIISQAQTDALDIFSQLSSNKQVALIKNLQLDSLTRVMPHGSIGTIATADVITIF